jgi:hypothetical protein
MTLYALNEGDCDRGIEVISHLWRKVDENYILPAYGAVRCGNFWLTFQDNQPVPSSEVKKDGTNRLSQNIGNKLPLLAA